jgi:hypothetical protein
MRVYVIALLGLDKSNQESVLHTPHAMRVYAINPYNREDT